MGDIGAILIPPLLVFSEATRLSSLLSASLRLFARCRPSGDSVGDLARILVGADADAVGTAEGAELDPDGGPDAGLFPSLAECARATCFAKTSALANPRGQCVQLNRGCEKSEQFKEHQDFTEGKRRNCHLRLPRCLSR